MIKKLLSGLILLTFGVSEGFGQQTQEQVMNLSDMSNFKEQSGNWSIVGEVSMDPSVDVRHKEEPPATSGKKRKKAREQKTPRAVRFEPGTGILLNINTEDKKSNLVTGWEHGDIYLELDFMMPKGSNSGLFLQGRYEIQLEDSWGVSNPKYSSIGGIYRNWETETDKIYMGKAPLTNAAKAPGLWQNLKISFQAPKFNDAGEKIANARILTAELNGVKIHENVEIPLPTGGPLENNEVAKGPIMIQGDHGPVAIRNFKYRHMRQSDVALTDLEYSFFPGKFQDIDDFSQTKPAKSGQSQVLTYEVGDVGQLFGLKYVGNIHIPEDNTYDFKLAAGGDARLFVNNKKIAESGSNKGTGSAKLEKGVYPIEILYNRFNTWTPPRLGLFVESRGTYSKALHTYTSFPQFEEMPAAILVHPGSGPKMLRAFLDYDGDRDRRLTHTIGVGEAGRAHYIYDLKAGNLVCVWRGDFIDATPMWNSRGDGSFKPLGLVQYLSPQPSLAVLRDKDAPFPEYTNEEDFRGKGYELEEGSGRPVFTYTYKGMEVEDKIYPGENNGMITREISIKNMNENQGVHLKLAEGDDISATGDGTYVIGDNQYYLKVASSSQPLIRKVDGKTELVLPVDGSPVKYSIIW